MSTLTFVQIAVVLSTREAAYMVYNFSRFCMSVCQSIIFIGSSYLHIWCISRQYRSSSYIKVIRSRSRSQDRKRSATDACMSGQIRFSAV